MTQPTITATQISDNDPIREAAQCAVCNQGFTPREWDDRHSDSEDVHEECCELCKANPT